MGKIVIEQDGDDCIVTMCGETRRIRHCSPLKLANTIWDKPGEQYSEAEMCDFGFWKLQERKNGNR